MDLLATITFIEVRDAQDFLPESRCSHYPFDSVACRAHEESGITYVVTEACIRCKFNDCVAICPVDCFYENESLLVIHPDECIDCGACVPAYPTDAIMLGSEPGAEVRLELNKRFCKIWPNINKKGETPADAESYVGMADKYDKYISENPGT